MWEPLEGVPTAPPQIEGDRRIRGEVKHGGVPLANAASASVFTLSSGVKVQRFAVGPNKQRAEKTAEPVPTPFQASGPRPAKGVR